MSREKLYHETQLFPTNQTALCPDFHEAIPGSRAQSASVSGNSDGGDTFVVSFVGQISLSLSPQCVPDDERRIRIRREQQTSRQRERQRCWRWCHVRIFHIRSKSSDLSPSSEIENSGSSVIGSGGEGEVVGEEMNDVHILLVTVNDMSRFSAFDIPRHDVVIASARHESVSGIIQGDKHNVTSVLPEKGSLGSLLGIPQSTSVITRARHYLSVVNETAAGEKTLVSGKLSRNFGWIVVTDIPHAAHIVESSRSDKVSRRGIAASHHPIRRQIYCIHL